MDLPSAIALVSSLWKERISLRPGLNALLLVGGVDSGKSTLAKELSTLLSRCSEVFLLDADPGQQSLSIPGCVGVLDLASGEKAHALVGSTSPSGVYSFSLLLAIEELLELCARRAEGREVCLVVDTCGMVDGGYGFGLLRSYAHLLRPRMTVVMGEEGFLGCRELISVFGLFGHLVRLKPLEGARRRGQAERRDRRRARLEGLLEEGTELELGPQDLLGVAEVPSGPQVYRPGGCYGEGLSPCLLDGLLGKVVAIKDRGFRTLGVGLCVEASGRLVLKLFRSWVWTSGCGGPFWVMYGKASLETPSGERALGEEGLACREM